MLHILSAAMQTCTHAGNLLSFRHRSLSGSFAPHGMNIPGVTCEESSNVVLLKYPRWYHRKLPRLRGSWYGWR